MPSTETTEQTAGEIARSYFEAIARQDLDEMTAHWEPGGTGEIHGLVELRAPDTYREWFGNLFAAFPDFRFEILDLVAEGDKAAVRWRATGTFNGPTSFEGMMPTGASVDITGCDVVTVRDGRIHRNDAYMNGAEMARQLGAMPPQGSTAEKAMTGALNLKTRLTGLLQRG
jgi:predicted ester cyclase